MTRLPPEGAPVTAVVPLAEPGLCLLTTASGSRHLVDTSDPDGAPQVARMPGAEPDEIDRFAVALLRRNAEWLPLLDAGWLDAETGDHGEGLRVGMEAVLLLDLRGDGVATVRQTTPVVTIEPVSDRDALTERAAGAQTPSAVSRFPHTGSSVGEMSQAQAKLPS
ncbi:hypothetical protein [Cellulosimicrobium funkei]